MQTSDASERDYSTHQIIVIAVVVVLLVLVHPHLGQPHGVALDHVDVCRERVMNWRMVNEEIRKRFH